jgi:transcriptional regulator with XRE-family HTH domain
MSVSTAKQELGLRIAQARLAKSVGGAELGALIGGDKTTISKIESGTRSVDGVELALIAQRLDVGVRELLGMPPRQKVLAVASRLRERGARSSSSMRCSTSSRSRLTG